MAHTDDTPTGDAVNQTPQNGDAEPRTPPSGDVDVAPPQGGPSGASASQAEGSPAVDPPEHASTDTSVGVYPEGYPQEWAADVLG